MIVEISAQQHPKIAVTGIGLVSALGCTTEDAVVALRTGRSGVRPAADLTGQPRAGQVSAFDPGRYVPKKKLRRMEAVNCYVIAATRMALEQAALDEAGRRGCGIVVGTGFAGLVSVIQHHEQFLDLGIGQLSPLHFPTTVYNASAGLAAIELGLTGPNTTLTGLDLPAEHALLYAALMLRGGMARQLVLVGADELSEALLRGLTEIGLVADAEGAGGLVPGEGAAALVLELEETARARGASVLGTIEGVGVASAGPVALGERFDYAPGAADAAVGQALGQAGLDAQAIGWISLGANGSPQLASAEASVRTRLPADRPLAELKRFTGEFPGSGALRLALGLVCARAGFVPALGGSTGPGADRPFLHLGLGIGGNAAAVVVRPAA
jgi:3-oxoacyl-[acyl-carrier-protein] synthase II